MIPILWIEGLIASGKTTFARKMGESLGFVVLEEPVDANPYLEEFYKDQRKYAFGMQIWLLHHRFAMKQIAAFEAARGVVNGIILDRSIAGDRVFERLHWKAGNISQLDHQCYEYCYQMMARTILPPTVVIYLNCQAETAYRRMMKRKRAAEKGVPLGYLQQLKEGYEELLNEIRTGLVPWSHAIHIERIIYDNDTMSDDEWANTARTVKDICRIGR